MHDCAGQLSAPHFSQLRRFMVSDVTIRHLCEQRAARACSAEFCVMQATVDGSVQRFSPNKLCTRVRSSAEQFAQAEYVVDTSYISATRTAPTTTAHSTAPTRVRRRALPLIGTLHGRRASVPHSGQMFDGRPVRQ